MLDASFVRITFDDCTKYLETFLPNQYLSAGLTNVPMYRRRLIILQINKICSIILVYIHAEHLLTCAVVSKFKQTYKTDCIL